MGGNSDPQIAGLYWAAISLGTPATSYKVQIDTGSDVTWIQCQPCSSCTKSSQLVKLAPPFSPESSSSSSILTCMDSSCTLLQSTQSNLGTGCSTVDESDDRCYYKLLYGDGSSTDGYAVTDKMHFDSREGSKTDYSVSFGCSYNQSGDLLMGGQSVDGLMGLGNGPWSVFKQLANQGVIADSFAHCLGGEQYGKGSLVLGSVKMENAVYTPLIYSGHYYVNLDGMSVGATKLRTVTRSSFGSIENGQGVIFDSGTSLALVPNQVYNAVVKEVAAQMSSKWPKIAQLPLSNTDEQYCWHFTGLEQYLVDIFPNITVEFEGGEMHLNAYNYMIVIQYGDNNSDGAACVVWQPSSSNTISITVLGDIILRDKLIVYDFEKTRVGWTYSDCRH